MKLSLLSVSLLVLAALSDASNPFQGVRSGKPGQPSTAAQRTRRTKAKKTGPGGGKCKKGANSGHNGKGTKGFDPTCSRATFITASNAKSIFDTNELILLDFQHQSDNSAWIGIYLASNENPAELPTSTAWSWVCGSTSCENKSLTSGTVRFDASSLGPGKYRAYLIVDDETPPYESLAWTEPFEVRLPPVNPFEPTENWVYAIEAIRSSPWPACRARFMSYPATCDEGVINLWTDVGESQQWEFEQTEENGIFSIKQTECDHEYLTYDIDCQNNQLSLETNPSDFQKFRFASFDDTAPGHYYIEAVGRVGQCPRIWLSFTDCSHSAPDSIDLWSDRGENQYFRIFPLSTSSPPIHTQVSEAGCADPFIWSSGDAYHLLCTGGDLALYDSSEISETSNFGYIGQALGGDQPSWLNRKQRWAPENYVTQDGMNVIFVSDEQAEENVHRIGYVFSDYGPGSRSWNEYGVDTLNLSESPGGEIDAHVFRDELNGKTYLLWKSDDNRVGSPVTYLWAQEIEFIQTHLKLIGAPQVLLDSAGLWWITSGVWEGSLIEGPQVVYEDGWYYLFFASGIFCNASYSEGVARSRSFWGPYEKLGVPLLSTGSVGVSPDGTKLIGPGHASYVKDLASNEWYSVWHASIGYNCDRKSFASKMRFGLSHGWPVMEL